MGWEKYYIFEYKPPIFLFWRKSVVLGHSKLNLWELSSVLDNSCNLSSNNYLPLVAHDTHDMTDLCYIRDTIPHPKSRWLTVRDIRSYGLPKPWVKRVLTWFLKPRHYQTPYRRLRLSLPPSRQFKDHRRRQTWYDITATMDLWCLIKLHHVSWSGGHVSITILGRVWLNDLLSRTWGLFVIRIQSSYLVQGSQIASV